jgi:hypothetical protein
VFPAIELLPVDLGLHTEATAISPAPRTSRAR